MLIFNIRKILQILNEIGIKCVAYRLYYEISKRLGVTYLKFNPKSYAKIKLKDVLCISTDNLLNYYRKQKKTNFLFSSEEKHLYKQNWLKLFSKKDLLRKSDKILRHQIDVLNFKNYQWNKNVDWHKNVTTNNSWPKKHWSLINIYSPKIGDVKYTWEINRHQHFFILGEAYWVTGEEKYAKEFIDEMEDWFVKNPPEIGVNWSNSLEIAIRLISWVFGFHFFLDSKYFDEKFFNKFLKYIFISTKHIEKNINLSRYCIANDHLIGEAAALFLIAMLFPEFKDAKKWQNIGIQTLKSQIKKQVYPDGVYFFHSVNYQRFVMEWYLLVSKIAEINNFKLPKFIKDRLNKMSIFIASLINDIGRPPVLGENDSSKLLKFSTDLDDFRPLLEDINMLTYKKPAFASNLVFRETFWLFGKDYWKKKEAHIFLNIPSKKSFPKGGYYILKNNKNKIIFHCETNRSGQGHADALHFDLMLKNKYYLLDNGTYLYNCKKPWRDYFKGTPSHNTVVVDDLDQMINWRRFRWLGFTKTRLKNFVRTSSGTIIEGEHYGYTRLKKPVIHNRKVILNKNKITIIDTLIGNDVHKLDLYFHFPKEKYQFDETKKIFTLRDHITTIKVIPIKDDNLRCEIKIGSNKPIMGWHSPKYGRKEKCITLKYSKLTKLPTSFITLILIKYND